MEHDDVTCGLNLALEVFVSGSPRASLIGCLRSEFSDFERRGALILTDTSLTSPDMGWSPEESRTDAVSARVPRLVRPLIGQRSVVFYNLTTLRAEGLSEQDGELRRFSLSKDGGTRANAC